MLRNLGFSFSLICSCVRFFSKRSSCSCCPAIFFSFVFILIVFWLIVGVYWVNIIKLVYIRNIKMRLSLLTKKKVI